MSLGHSRAFCAWTPPRASWSIPGISTSSVKLLGIPQDDQIRPWDIPRRSDTPGRALGICWGARARGCHTYSLALPLHRRMHAQWYCTTSNASKRDHTSGGRKGRRWDRATRGPRTRKSSFFSDCNASISVQTHTGAAESEEADQLRP